ncbi:MAG: chromosome segregation protein SMC [Clostridiales bacterium]|nr:chromosome segregation protein SMC [Clostridiales bacterium]
MYLKSIEIQGFKSFANRIVLEFHNGITAIVGPNGSGKSNIADAVRWVLGEQKVKQLRSSSMQDVIFAGTENRKAVSFASVAITLDNADHALALDYDELTVARRVYRSGESEYLLNGTPCRLRDIQELFYDTGIGKEGYSIIGQGQIDRILSGKPEERRELFDEAAGIVKFKRRKMTTVKKLENERQNMVRITDILTELERQVGPLKRQSEQARIYLKKKDELKTYEVNLFLQEMERMERESVSVQEKYEIADCQYRETSEEYEQIRLHYEEGEQKIRENEERISELQTRISENDVEREKLEGRIRVLQEQIHTIEQSEAHVQERLAQIGTEIESRQRTGQQYSDEREETGREIAAAEEEKQRLEAELEELQRRADAAGQEIEDGKKEILRILDARSEIEGGRQRYHTILEQADIRRAQLNRQLIERQSAGSDAEKQLQKQEKAFEQLNEEILELEKKKINLNGERRKRQQQEEELSARLDESRQQFHRESSRLESLKNIAERYDGYGNSIRRVMERRSDTPGICGVVADLIRVEKKYETAIETALGGSIQNIVTDNEDTAKSMIAYLKKNRYGRATFLPLTSVSAPEHVPAGKALGEEGAIGMADTLVQTQERYRRVAGYLLGRILVADTIDHAIAIEKKYRYSLRIVTLEGESLQPGGSMTGGAFKNSSNLLGRGREIEVLEKKIKEIRQESVKIKDRLEEIRTADELLKEDLDEMQDALQDFYMKKNALQVEVEHLREEEQQQEASYRSIQDEIRKLEDEKRETEEEQQHVLLQVSESRQREEELSAANEALSAQLDQMRAEADRLQEEISEKTVNIARLRQKSDFSRENIQRVSEEILGLHQTQQEILLNASNSGQEIRDREQEIAELTAACGAADQNRESLSGQLLAHTADKEALSRENKGFFERREALAEQLSRLDKEVFRLNDRREKLEQGREDRADYMWREYELTIQEAQKLRAKELPGTAELKNRISGVKDEIRKLGNINVNAIEEYKEISERYEFLKRQHEDLLQAEKTLTDIIADLDAGMKKQFQERFADIQEAFDRTFQQMFGGGRGSLELAMEDGKDLLDCGVRIIAQPPGKKLQNMMQLSGGEKALTAIALLFAIQDLKPSPFCLLDEIEAALDDSNVDRYARYLHKLTQHTQFIIITHRRGTMTAADRLYGITMQEKGVSTLVSVNLIEKELEE